MEPTCEYVTMSHNIQLIQAVVNKLNKNHKISKLLKTSLSSLSTTTSISSSFTLIFPSFLTLLLKPVITSHPKNLPRSHDNDHSMTPRPSRPISENHSFNSQFGPQCSCHVRVVCIFHQQNSPSKLQPENLEKEARFG